MRTQVLLGIFDDRGQIFAKMDRSHRKGDAAFQQGSADLVDQGGATLYQSITNPVHGLHIELLVGLDWHEAHILLRNASAMASNQ